MDYNDTFTLPVLASKFFFSILSADQYSNTSTAGAKNLQF